MQAILFDKHGTSEELYLGTTQKPVLKEGYILVKVHATALNRADILQRQGKYPPPKGASSILGLEIAGEIIAVGKGCKKKVGERVFALLSGGAYAQYALVHEEMLMSIPHGWTYVEAAAIPEAFLTAFQALNYLAKIQKGEKILIHAGASGVGTAAIQLAKVMGAEVWATASNKKHAICYSLGAKKVIDYQNVDFEKEILHSIKGVDVIIDFIGANYFKQNINCLNKDGRLILLALLGGYKVENFNIAKILTKRLQITGTTLRSRSLAYQIQLTKDFIDFGMPLFAQKKLSPVIDTVFDWKDVQTAHQYMEDNKNRGKIVLKVS